MKNTILSVFFAVALFSCTGETKKQECCQADTVSVTDTAAKKCTADSSCCKKNHKESAE